MTQFNKLQSVKRDLFAMRNGIIADTLRRAGSPFKIIFGLNIPQIAEIAESLGKDPELAEVLWENTSTRESMLLAPLLMNPAEISVEKASEMVMACPDIETLDFLCHRLLRHSPDGKSLTDTFLKSEESKMHYAAMRMVWHQIQQNPDNAKKIAEQELQREDPLTSRLAKAIIEEIDFLNGF